MSVRPEAHHHGPKKITLGYLQSLKGRKDTAITTLTAYDFPTGRQCEMGGVDVCLVGDSLAQVCLGYDSTTRLTMDEIIHHAKAVSRAAKRPFRVADMPFGSYLGSRDATIANAIRFIQEAGMESVKLEGGQEIADTVKALTSVGIPVLAHIGLLPQRHVALSGYKVQGRDAASALRLLDAARALQDAGAWGIVLEAIPHRLAEYITTRLKIPTIGIGAGPDCDGQVLVWDDAMGVWSGHQARFVRRFAQLSDSAHMGVTSYVGAVKTRSFPDRSEESYEIDDQTWSEFISRAVE